MSQKQKLESRRISVNPYSIWTKEAFAKMVDRICGEEIASVTQYGHEPPTDDEREEMRHLVAFNINAHVVPAGNA